MVARKVAHRLPPRTDLGQPGFGRRAGGSVRHLSVAAIPGRGGSETAGNNHHQTCRDSRIVRSGLTMQDWELICQALALTLNTMLAARSTHLVGRIHVDLGRMRSAICCPSMF